MAGIVGDMNNVHISFWIFSHLSDKIQHVIFGSSKSGSIAAGFDFMHYSVLKMRQIFDNGTIESLQTRGIILFIKGPL